MSLANQQAPAEPLVEIDIERLAPALGFAPVPVPHRLAGHPLLTRQALDRLAHEHPGSWMLHHLAELPLMMPLDQLPQLEAPPGEVAEGIETNGSRLTLYYLERLSAYKALASDCVAPIMPLLQAEGGVERASVNVFMASPGAVVPAHFDNHHNLLLQIEGTKEVFVGAFSNPASGHREIERAFNEGRNNCGQLPTVVASFLLKPGTGLYIPPYLFHWVKGRYRGVNSAQLRHLVRKDKATRAGAHVQCPSAPSRDGAPSSRSSHSSGRSQDSAHGFLAALAAPSKALPLTGGFLGPEPTG